MLLKIISAILTVVAGRRHLRESADPETRVPALLGAALIAVAAALVSLAVVQGDEWGWVDARTLGAAVLGLVFLGLFVAHQSRTSAPALDLSLLRIRNFAWANATTFAFGVGFTAMFFGSFLFLTEVWRWSVLKAGLGISPGPLLVAVLAPQMGRLTARIGQRPLLVAGGLSFAAAGVIRALVMDSYDWFVGLVDERRPLNRAEVLALADGSIFTGRQALQRKLVDELGGEREALAWLGSKGVGKELEIIEWLPRDEGNGWFFASSFATAAAGLLGFEVGRLLGQVGADRLFLDGLVSVWHPDASTLGN